MNETHWQVKLCSWYTKTKNKNSHIKVQRSTQYSVLVNSQPFCSCFDNVKINIFWEQHLLIHHHADICLFKYHRESWLSCLEGPALQEHCKQTSQWHSETLHHCQASSFWCPSKLFPLSNRGDKHYLQTSCADSLS